jgi:hypothetical protein
MKREVSYVVTLVDRTKTRRVEVGARALFVDADALGRRLEGNGLHRSIVRRSVAPVEVLEVAMPSHWDVPPEAIVIYHKASES